MPSFFFLVQGFLDDVFTLQTQAGGGQDDMWELVVCWQKDFACDCKMLFVFWAWFFYQHFWDIVTFGQLRQRH